MTCYEQHGLREPLS